MKKYDEEWLKGWIAENRAKEELIRRKIEARKEIERLRGEAKAVAERLRDEAKERRRAVRAELQAQSAVGRVKYNADGSRGVWTPAENAARARARAKEREILARCSGIAGTDDGGGAKRAGGWGVSADLERKLDAGLAQWGDEATQAAWRDRWANPESWWATRASGRK
jgi:hypothetical protein